MGNGRERRRPTITITTTTITTITTTITSVEPKGCGRKVLQVIVYKFTSIFIKVVWGRRVTECYLKSCLAVWYNY